MFAKGHTGAHAQQSLPQKHRPGMRGKSRLCTDRIRAFLVVMTAVWLALLWWLVAPRSEPRLTVVDYFTFQGTHNHTPLIFDNPHASAWTAHPHLVVMGLLMGNDNKSFELREAQMDTWGRYSEVARLSNGFKGLVLPLYVAGLQTTTTPYWHPRIKALSVTERNVVITRIVEKASTTNKVVGVFHPDGYGHAALFSNSRKTVIWFIYAYNQFRYTPFLAKGDLDIYLNVPAYLTVLQQLPRVSTLFGKPREKRYRLQMFNTTFHYVLGPLYTHSRDLVAELASDVPFMRRVEYPYDTDDLATIIALGLHDDDTLFSYVLYRRYWVNKEKRSFPMAEWQDALTGAAQLPPVAGMGKLYMDYVANITDDVPVSGRVDGLLGYSYDYTLPGPIDPLHFIMVMDWCRLKDEHKVNLKTYRILTHNTATAEMFRQYQEKDFKRDNTFSLMPHPSVLNVTDADHFLYLLDLCEQIGPYN